MEINISMDPMVCSNSENEFGFNLDSWEYAELFGKKAYSKVNY